MTSLDAAVAAAVRILAGARFPLVYGLHASTVEAQREAVRVARLLRGVIDPASTSAHAGSLAAFQQDGGLLASLGEMRRRADLIVFWGCDPDRDHPGFLARFGAARPGRVRVAVDLGDYHGPREAEERISLLASRETAALAALCAFVRGRRVDEAVAAPLGVPLAPLRALAQRLLACAYGAMVVEGDPAPERREPARAMLLARVARDARHRARLRLVSLREPGNPVGAESVLTWLTGFPGAVSFATGQATFGPGEFDAEALLSRGDVDAALVVGVDPATRHFSPAALAHLATIPNVRLAPQGAPGAGPATLFVATANLGESAGHVFRMDGLVPAPRSPASRLTTEAVVLARIADMLEARRGAA